MVIKCKPKGWVAVEEVSKQAYQTNDPCPSRVVIDTDIPSNLYFILGKVDIIELPMQYSIKSVWWERASTEDEKLNDNVETESDEDSP